MYNGEVFLDVDRILPQEEMKDYTLKLAEKSTCKEVIHFLLLL
jgi:hypothetical protein